MKKSHVLVFSIMLYDKKRKLGNVESTESFLNQKTPIVNSDQRLLESC